MKGHAEPPLLLILYNLITSFLLPVSVVLIGIPLSTAYPFNASHSAINSSLQVLGNGIVYPNTIPG
ncbi:MAG: hypothetical protein ACO2OY_07260, partial [Thermodesulfobacteriaceae bacterium]